MEFRTEVKVAPSTTVRLAHGRGPVAFLGSCFADNIARRLRADLFDVIANPFGTLYNPFSVLRHLQGRPFTPDDLVEGPDGLWHSWHHGTALSAESADVLLENVNTLAADFRSRLASAQALFVTYGTSTVYTLKDGRAVANCHKMAPSVFDVHSLTPAEVADISRAIVRAAFPVPVVFTVSPVRYVAPTLHHSQLAKAALLLGIDSAGADYFPAYEAVIDDLRDYRFFAADLVHPSDMAADYVYELFGRCFFDPADAACLADCRKYARLAAHRPISASRADEHRARVEAMRLSLTERYGIHP